MKEISHDRTLSPSKIITPNRCSPLISDRAEHEAPYELPDHAKKQSELPDFPNNNDINEDKMASEDGGTRKRAKRRNSRAASAQYAKEREELIADIMKDE